MTIYTVYACVIIEIIVG